MVQELEKRTRIDVADVLRGRLVLLTISILNFIPMEFSRLQIPRKSNERLRFGELKIVRPCLRPRFATEKQWQC